MSGADVHSDNRMGLERVRAAEFLKLAEENREMLHGKVHVVVPVRPFTGVNVHLAKMLSIWYGEGVSWDPFNDYMGGFIECTRARIALQFIKEYPTYKYLLMIDDDIEPAVELPYLLARHDKPVVGSCCMSFSSRFGPMMCFSMKDGNGVYRFPPLVTAKNGKAHPQMIPSAGLAEVGHCGTGAMLIRRDVLEAFSFEDDDIPFYVDEKVRREGFKTGTLRRGEDIEFCRQVKEKGFSVHVDLEAQCAHRKMSPLSWPDDQRSDEMSVDDWKVHTAGMEFE